MSFLRRLLVLYLLLGSPLCLLRAEINEAYSPEGLAHQADLIATATPLSVDVQKGPGAALYTFTRFVLKDVIKGPLSAGDIVTVCDRNLDASDVPHLNDALPSKPEVLIFCAIPKSPGESKSLSGKYAMLNLLGSTAKAIFLADQPVRHLYTEDFKPLTQYADLLERATAQVKAESDRLRYGQWPGSINLKQIDIPFDAPAFKELCAGSACFLLVPSYDVMDREIVVLSPKDAPRFGKEPGFYNAATFVTDKVPFARTNEELRISLKDLPVNGAGLRFPDKSSAETFDYMAEILRYLYQRGVVVACGSWIGDKWRFGPVNNGD